MEENTVGRFAPSPSGRMHLGNLFCALMAWLAARAEGGRMLLRVEDLDQERCPRKYADLLEEDLLWLGLSWEEGGSRGGQARPLLPKRAHRRLPKLPGTAAGHGACVPLLLQQGRASRRPGPPPV